MLGEEWMWWAEQNNDVLRYSVVILFLPTVYLKVAFIRFQTTDDRLKNNDSL